MMKKFIFTSAILIALASCNQKPSTELKTNNPEPKAEKKIELKLSELATGKDLVCGMPVEEGGISDTATYHGKIYGFCSSDCKAEFLKDPEKYLAQK